MQPGRPEHPPTAAHQSTRHQHRLRDSAGAVVHRSVTDIHARQHRHQCLKLEDRLQRPLGDFRLIGRVRGHEFLALYEGIDMRRHEVRVAARAEEAQGARRRAVGGRELAQVSDQLWLGQSRLHRKVAAIAKAVGNRGEKLVHTRDTDDFQHLVPVVRAERLVPTGALMVVGRGHRGLRVKGNGSVAGGVRQPGRISRRRRPYRGSSCSPSRS